MYEAPRVVKFIQTPSRMVVTRGWGCVWWNERGGIGSYCLLGTEFQFQIIRKVLKLDSGSGYTSL